MGERGSVVLRNPVQRPARGTQVFVLRRTRTSFNDLPDIDVTISDMTNDSGESLAEVLSPFHTAVNCNGVTRMPETPIKPAQAAVLSRCQRVFSMYLPMLS